ncbi:MAG TPA: glycosyl transferase, partial [Paracoccaceae bacterium]|nr:glycosyl transferase [Paracoccaceae bacterium]
MVLWAAILGWVLVLGQLGVSGVLGLAIGWVTIVTGATTIFRITALRGLRTLKPTPPLLAPTELPKVSLLIPLFEEEQVAGGLVKALERLTYPRQKLQVLFLTEASDTKTRDALAKANLPDW